MTKPRGSLENPLSEERYLKKIHDDMKGFKSIYLASNNLGGTVLNPSKILKKHPERKKQVDLYTIATS